MAKLALILLSTYFFAGNLFAGALIMHSKKIPIKMPGGSGALPTEIFIDGNDNIFLMVGRGIAGQYRAIYLCVFMNEELIDLEGYGHVWDGFLKDGDFHLVLWKDGGFSVYKVLNGMKLVTRINIEDTLHERFSSASRYRGPFSPGKIYRVIPVPEAGNSFYLLACRWRFPVHPGEFLKTVISGGHGISYWKPFSVEVRDEKLAKPRKLRYGGKIEESYYIKQVINHEDLVHFLGFRRQEEPAWGRRKRTSESMMLHHAAYDLKKKKVIHTHTIYTISPKIEIGNNRTNFYGPLSIDASGNDVFVVFSWVQERLQPRPVPINDMKSTIFYWQYSNGVASEVEKIADGFMPLVKVDSSGTVHVLWVNKNASLVHKAKRNNKWSKDTILFNNLDVDHRIISGRYISAEFDKDNNLNVVFPSNGNLVYAKLRLNLMPGKQN